MLFFCSERIIRGDMQLTPADCWEVLRAAQKDFLKVIGKVIQGQTEQNTSECLIVLYYLEALVVLKHLQRPGVVENMTVSIVISFLLVLHQLI